VTELASTRQHQENWPTIMERAVEGIASRGECGFPAEAGGATPPGRRGEEGGGEGQAAGAGSLPCGKGAGHATWRRFTVVAPAGAVGVGDPLAAERLALLRCRPWLLAVQ